jgi:glycosyltransferase involved in cell wall biosynthesis
MIETEEPLVSIIMNCYNGEKYLREALDSVLAQTYKKWELIFWDNQSTDGSQSIINSYNDERINYYYAPKHTMLSEARNCAIANTTGKYIAFLDVDDYWDKVKIEKQMNVFSTDDKIAMVYSNYHFNNETKGTIKIQYKSILPEGIILDDLLSKNVVGLLTMTINREIIDNNRGILFDPNLHIIGDYDLVIKIAAKHKIACVQQPLATYRWHGANETITSMERQLEELERWGLEMQSCPTISRNIGFNKFLDYVRYLKGMQYVMKGDLKNSLSLLYDISLYKNKLKLLFSIIMPLSIIKLFRT